jgi:hypothetical protein
MFATVNTYGYIDTIYASEVEGSIELPVGADQNTGYRYKRVENEWVDGFPGVAEGVDLMVAYNLLNTEWTIASMKIPLLSIIKDTAATQIQALNWKVERATEVDAATGSTTLVAVYAERAAIRTASNTKEAALDAITTYEDLDTFDATDF